MLSNWTGAGQSPSRMTVSRTEERFILTGRAADGILTVVYTERNGRIRIISAREANDYERRNYYRAAQED